MRTSDNRDHGGVGIGGHEALCVIADGSTTAPDSGALARAIIRALVDWYVAYDQVITKQTLLAQLALIHRDLSKQHPRASASYLIVHIGKGGVRLVLHAGDCLLGRVDDNGAVEWLTRPHTLPNAISDIIIAEIIALPERHRLTRSFRYREYMAPRCLGNQHRRRVPARN
jgi:serine/threonine protein phosphatase PrpC